MTEVHDQRFHHERDHHRSSHKNSNGRMMNSPHANPVPYRADSYALKTPQSTHGMSGQPNHSLHGDNSRAAVVTASTPIHKAMRVTGSHGKLFFEDTNESKHSINHQGKYAGRDEYNRNSTPLARRIFASPDSSHPSMPYDHSNHKVPITHSQYTEHHSMPSAHRHVRGNSQDQYYYSDKTSRMEQDYHRTRIASNEATSSIQQRRSFSVPPPSVKHPLRHRTMFPSPDSEESFEKDHYHNREVIFRPPPERDINRERPISRTNSHDRQYYHSRHPSSPDYSRFPREYYSHEPQPVSKQAIPEQQSQETTHDSSSNIKQESVEDDKKTDITKDSSDTVNTNADNSNHNTDHKMLDTTSKDSPKASPPKSSDPINRREEISPITRQNPHEVGNANSRGSHSVRNVDYRKMSGDGDDMGNYHRRQDEYRSHSNDVASRYYDKREHRPSPRYHSIEESDHYHYTSGASSSPPRPEILHQHHPRARHMRPNEPGYENGYRSDPMEDKENVGYSKRPSPSPYLIPQAHYPPKHPRHDSQPLYKPHNYGYVHAPPPTAYAAHRGDHHERGIAASPIERDLDHTREYHSTPYYYDGYPMHRHEGPYATQSYHPRAEDYKTHYPHYEDERYYYSRSRPVHYRDDYERHHLEDYSSHYSYPNPRKLYGDEIEESRLHRHPKEVLDSQRRSAYGAASPILGSTPTTVTRTSSLESKKRKSESKAPTPHVSQRKRKKMYSDYVGVTYNKTHAKFQACITHYRKQHYLGRYKLAVDAAKAYDKSARLLKGKGWKINFRTEEDYVLAKKKEEEKVEKEKKAAELIEIEKKSKEAKNESKSEDVKQNDNDTKENSSKSLAEEQISSSLQETKKEVEKALKPDSIIVSQKEISVSTIDQENEFSSNKEVGDSRKVSQSRSSPVRTVSNDELSFNEDTASHDSNSQISKGNEETAEIRIKQKQGDNELNDLHDQKSKIVISQVKNEEESDELESGGNKPKSPSVQVAANENENSQAQPGTSVLQNGTLEAASALMTLIQRRLS